MNKTDALQNLVDSSVTRRDFARRTMGVTLGAAAGGTLMLGMGDSAMAQSITDVDVLNFALNLEYLEAEFYTVATTGQRIADIGIGVTGRGRQGATVGGARVSLDTNAALVANAVAADEQAHVVFLRTALRGAVVAKPAINLEALTIGFRSQAEFLTLARAFEDLGVSAYGGAAKLLDNSVILEATARIALAEGYHAGVIRYLIALANAPVPPIDAKDVLPLGSPNGKLFALDANGLTVVRTASEVLKVAYGGGTNRGGFFPDGVNGDIATA
jgi:Ferritin-like domain